VLEAGRQLVMKLVLLTHVGILHVRQLVLELVNLTLFLLLELVNPPQDITRNSRGEILVAFLFVRLELDWFAKEQLVVRPLLTHLMKLGSDIGKLAL
jgi:hypothetical protein